VTFLGYGAVLFLFCECRLLPGYGQRSYAPLSKPAPSGRGVPSISAAGAPAPVPVSMHGESGCSWTFAGRIHKQRVDVDVAYARVSALNARIGYRREDLSLSL